MQKISFGFSALFVFLLCSNTALARDPEHSKLMTTITELPDQRVAIEFKVETVGKIVINDDKNVPWQLQVKDPKSIAFKTLDFKRDAYDDQIPGFKIESEKTPQAESWALDYRLVAFICTKSKDRCYREVHTGTLKNNIAKKPAKTH